MTTKTRLSALAFAAAAFTATMLLAGSAPAGTESTVANKRLPTSQASTVVKVAPGAGGTVLPAPKEPPKLGGGHGPACPPGAFCPRLPGSGGDHDGDRDHDHDHDHDYGYYRDRDHDHDYGYYRDRDHDHDYGYYRDHDYGYYRYPWYRYSWYGYPWYGSHERPEIVVGGAPGPVEVAPAVRPAPPVPVAVPQAPAAPQPAAEPCNCLTKQTLPDGSVLFQDICTKESAIAPPQAAAAR